VQGLNDIVLIDLQAAHRLEKIVIERDVEPRADEVRKNRPDALGKRGREGEFFVESNDPVGIRG
jgi:hypothetical protein